MTSMLGHAGILILFGVCFSFCGFAKVLASDEDEIKNALRNIGESNNVINVVFDMLETQFEELDRANEDRKAEKAARAEEINKKKEIWRERLDKLENEIAELEIYKEQEDDTDFLLESLSGHGTVRNYIDDQIEQIQENIGQMKTFNEDSLVDVDMRLTSVKQSAISRNVKVAGVVLYGGVGSACSFTTDCVLTSSECRHKMCQCVPGLSFDSLRNKCTEVCPVYGTTYQFTKDRMISGFNNLDLTEKSLAECKKECERDDLGFTCRSFDYFPDWKQCFLSEITVTEVPDSSWTYNSAGIHFQRDCAYTE